MALKLKITKLEDVAEGLRSMYKPDGDAFVLDVDGIEDNSGLKSALEKERTNARDAVKQAAAWKALGKTPEEIQALVEAQAQAERDKLTKAGEWDKLAKQMTDAHALEITKQGETAKGYRAQLERHLVDAAAVSALAAAKGNAELLLPHVKARTKVVEENGEFVLRVVDAKGDPRVNTKGEFLSMSDLVGEMRGSDVYAPAFLAPGASGGGSQQSGQTNTGRKTVTRSQFDAMPQLERATFAKAGGAVVD